MKAIILAGGKGTRFNDEENPMPKVLRLADGKPLLGHVTESINYINKQDIMIVVGYMSEEVMEAFNGHRFVKQGTDGYGTGYALKCGYVALEPIDDNDIMVLQGDTPLVKSETLRKMCEEHINNNSSCTLLSCVSERQLPFGRIIRNADGTVKEIVEQKNCTSEQLKIRELNVGMYIFDSVDLKDALGKMEENPLTKEYYLTNIMEIMCRETKRVDAFVTLDETEMWGVNTFEDLKAVEEILINRRK
ncbi:MAG: NTP transferase domain-containing protein [Oscillospiraceae bacterium]|nr:NTP transferase domain-containing protein [Oscillospiraceae bacterium]